MKVSFIKKFISIMLTIVICIVPLLSIQAFATDENTVPNIIVHGFMSCSILADKDDKDSEDLWPPSSDRILNAVKEAIPSLAELAFSQDWDKFANEASKIANTVFEDIMNNPDGTAKGNTGPHFSYPSESSINKDSCLRFKYDWRGDPIEIAAQLNDFIDYVIKCSGSDTVTIQCHSLGGVITTTYLTLYGNSKISGVAFNSTAVYGETYNGELMSGKLRLYSEGFQNYFKFIFSGTEYENLFDSIIDMLAQAGIINAVVNLSNSLLDHILETISRESIVPLFGRWLTIWSMVPDEYIDDAIKFVFEELYKDSETDYSALREKVENFNNLVRYKKTDTLNELNQKANVYVLSRYGFSSIPISPSHRIMGDGVIDTKFSSFGATTSLYDEQLSDDYLKNADPAYISPDKCVDASTCLFPEQTWFLKNKTHGDNPESIETMLLTLLHFDGQATVETFEQYPRFLIYNAATDTISPFTVYEKPSIFDKLVLILKEAMKYIMSLLTRISVAG